MNDPLISFLLACGFHTVLLFGTAAIFVQPPRYEVEGGSGGTEVMLVAAPARTTGSKTAAHEQKPLPAPETAPDNELQTTLPETTGETDGPVGDGSSPVPGNDPTTFYLPGGAVNGTHGKLKNPAPIYPYQAIRQGEEGVVMLEVLVDKSGRPTSVEVYESSGFPILDQSALWTVRRWKFDPAHVGLIPTNARIRVPIRFKLDKKLEELQKK